MSGFDSEWILETPSMSPPGNVDKAAVIPVRLPSFTLNILWGLLTLFVGNEIDEFIESLMCPVVRRCICNKLFVMKRSPQLHPNGLSPVWRRTCKVKSFDCVKARSHWVHLYGRSPVWILKNYHFFIESMCSCNVKFLFTIFCWKFQMNDRPQRTYALLYRVRRMKCYQHQTSISFQPLV